MSVLRWWWQVAGSQLLRSSSRSGKWRRRLEVDGEIPSVDDPKDCGETFSDVVHSICGDKR